MMSRKFMYMIKNVFNFVKSALLYVCNTNLKDACIGNKISKTRKMIGIVRLACTFAV